jgi:hypothetical protein
MQQAQQQVVRTRSRPQPGPRPKWSGRGPWIALAMGGVAAVVGIAALLLWLLSDEPVAPRPRRAASAIAPQPQLAELAPAPPVQPKPAPQAAPAERAEPQPPPPRRVIGAGKLYGTLSVNPQGGAPVTFAGSAQPKQVGAYNLPVTADTGTVEVGDSSTAFKVRLEYLRSGGGLNLKISSSAGADVWVDGASRGSGPVVGVKLESRQTLIELKRPGDGTGMLVKLHYRPN